MLPIRDYLPTRRPVFVVYVLIALNILVSVWLFLLRRAHVDPHYVVAAWGLVPARLLASPWRETITVFSSMFLHDPTDYWHIGGNMLFLWIFGDNVEDAMGSLRFIVFYLLSGIFAAAAQIVIDPSSTVPMIGASGAISGVLAAYGSLYPRAPVSVLNPIPILWLFWGLFFDLPAWFVILEYFVVNLLNALGSLGARGGGVAFFAHIGGFVAGLFLVRLFMRGRGAHPYERWKQLVSRRRVDR